jgi:CzcA family heavy metal efflux pump
VNLAAFSARHTRALVFLTGALTATGLLIGAGLPVSLFPTVAFPRVQVLADVGDRPADRMMVEVTRTLEEAVNTVPGLVNVRSLTSRGSCEISLNFRWGVPMDTTLVLVQGAIEQVRPQLPAETRVRVRRMDPTVFPVIAYSLSSATTDPVAVRDLALYRLRPLLAQVPGVAQAVVLGGETREVAVAVDPDRLAGHGVTLDDVQAAIANSNVIRSVGRIEQDYKLYLVVVTGEYADLDAVRATVVKERDGVPVTLGEVADVGPSVEPQWIRVMANGSPAILLNVYQQRDANTVAIAAQVERVLRRYEAKLPRDVVVSKYYDQSDLIVASMHSVRDSILVGIGLGVLVLFAFLRHARSTLIAAVGVPVSIGTTLIVLRMFGDGLNIMTLGGIAASVGLILDDAIVVIENLARHVGVAGRSPRRSVELGVAEMTTPVIASSLCSIVVHAPLAFLTGVTGAFFASLSLTVVAALVASLAFSLFVVPPLAMRFLGAELQAAHGEEAAPPGRLRTRYADAMTRWLRRPAAVLVVVAATCGASWLLYQRLESGFLPDMDEGAFILDYLTPPGTSLTETNRILDEVADILRKTPEVASFSLRTGLRLSGGVTEPNQGDFLVKLVPPPRRHIGEVIDAVRRRVLSTIPGLHVSFAQLMEDLIGDLTAVPQPIEIKVFGDDLGRAQATARRIAASIAEVPGIVDVFDGVTVAGPTMRVAVESARAGRFGLTARDVADSLGTVLAGRADTNVLHQEKLVPIRVRYGEPARRTADDLLAVRLPLADGRTVPVAAVGEVRVEPGTTQIAREDLKQMVAVTARIAGNDLGGSVQRVQRRLRETVPVPPDEDVVYGGLYREQQASFRGLLLVLLAAIGLVFVVLLFTFESYRAPLAILVVDAMSLAGVLLLLWLTDTPLNVSSLMGMIMIVGIVAENGVFLLFYADLLCAEGEDPTAALVQAGALRARPIVMTTLAAVLALLPLALGIGAGAEMQRPLAIAVIGGFTISVPLLLFCLPPLYRLGVRASGVARRPAA